MLYGSIAPRMQIRVLSPPVGNFGVARHPERDRRGNPFAVIGGCSSVMTMSRTNAFVSWDNRISTAGRALSVVSSLSLLVYSVLLHHAAALEAESWGVVR
jgi:hypothetical protein